MLHRQFGPEFVDSTQVAFQVDAPAVAQLELVIEGQPPIAMKKHEERFRATVDATHGDRYRFRLPSGQGYPDPASRFQPEGVHGPSQLIDPRRYTWHDSSWKGVQKRDLIFYELHVGTFTNDGTYLAAISRLDELVDLGITAIELMPLAQSAGKWNWGYDGVQFFAPRETYGSPDDLKRLIDAAHIRGLAVIHDVVYNHFGAEGNYLHPFGGYISGHHQTAWGDAPNTDGHGSRMMRDYLVANASFWIEEYHFDGLRLDATHCICDDSETHIVHEIGLAFHVLQSTLDRELHLIAESNVYDPDLLRPLSENGHGFDALWCDDLLHSVSANLQPGIDKSHRHYEPHEDLSLTLSRGYVYQETFKSERRKVPLSETDAIPRLDSLVFSIQNHDFIGNHPDGKRLHQIASPEAQKAAAALMFCYPALPMIFMGEEFACEHPYYFFTDFGDEHLRHAVESGRRAEYPQHDWEHAVSPISEEAFVHSKIGSCEAGSQSMLTWYRQLIALRKRWQATNIMNQDAMTARWDRETQTANIQYPKATAIIRLHGRDDIPSDLDVTITGKATLAQNATETENGFTLGASGVIVSETI